MAVAPAQPHPRALATLGPRIRALREGLSLSLRDLAERSGVSAPMLSQVERGETSPTLAVAARIAEAIVYAIQAPQRVNVNEILIRPTGQQR